MLLNAEEISKFVTSDNELHLSQVGIDLTIRAISQIQGGEILKNGNNITKYQKLDTDTYQDKDFILLFLNFFTSLSSHSSKDHENLSS